MSFLNQIVASQVEVPQKETLRDIPHTKVCQITLNGKFFLCFESGDRNEMDRVEKEENQDQSLCCI